GSHSRAVPLQYRSQGCPTHERSGATSLACCQLVAHPVGSSAILVKLACLRRKQRELAIHGLLSIDDKPVSTMMANLYEHEKRRMPFWKAERIPSLRDGRLPEKTVERAYPTMELGGGAGFSRWHLQRVEDALAQQRQIGPPIAHAF